MRNKVVDFEQIIEDLPVVSMRLSYEDQQWDTWFISKNIEMYGYSRQDFLDGKLSWVDFVHPDDRVVALKQAHDYVIRKIDDFKLQYRILMKGGESIWMTEYSHVIRDADGEPYCVDSMLLNTTRSKIGEDKIEDHYRQQLVLNDILMSLHDADLEQALQIILDRAGAYLDTSRALLFKDSPDHTACKVVYEWLNKGITSVKDLDYAITYSTEMPEIYVALQETGMLLVNAGEIPENCREEFEHEGLVSSAIFAVYLNGQHYGFVCFDDCVIERTWDENTANFLKNISNLISTVLMRIHTVEQLAMTQRTYETVLDNVDAYIFATHPTSNKIIFANKAFRDIFGSDCVGHDSEDYIKLTPMLHDRREGETDSASGADDAASSNGLTSYEVYFERKRQWLAATRELVPWVDGENVHLVNCYDITAKKQYEESIKRIAYQDYLTRLPNRYRCEVDLKASLADSKAAGQPGYLFFIDLDDFKIVNDCYGHDYGDGVLISFADYLKVLFEEDNHVFRFGGDEFVIIVNHNDGYRVSHFLKSMVKRAEKPWKSLDKSFYCTLSIGVVEFGPEEEEVKSILKKADIAMYHAKKMGKNNFVYYQEGFDSATIERSTMETLLRRSMENDFQGFEVYYQPYGDISGKHILGAEALVRMHGPDGELLLPEQFIGLAEYLGLIVPLGEHILRQAATQCKRINDSGLPDFNITVNLSVRQFKQKRIVGRLEEILKQTGVNLSNVIIGINEGVAIGELERMLMLCSEFRKQGIRVALDDFGSGSSSFINMRSLPVDIIRVSSRYIDAIDDDFTGYFVKLVTDLSHFSGKTVCINGVETEEQLEFCRRMGVDMVQGFLFYRPASVEKLYELVR